MAISYRAAFCFQNAADTASFTVPGSLPLTPPALLQNPHPSIRCRVESDTMAITGVLVGATTIDTFGLFGIRALSSSGVDLTSSIVSRVRASLSDLSALDGAGYDSGSAAGRVSAYYRNLVGLRDGSSLVRAVRFDLTAGGAAFIEAGFPMIGLRNQVTINYAPGEQDTPIDPSVKTTTRSQATHVDDLAPDGITPRKWNFDFSNLTETERFGWIEDLDRLYGARKNVMMIRNCASSNLGRDTMLGLITTGTPIVTKDSFLSDGARGYSKSFELIERH
jgi:hypothetical protein